MYYLFEYICVQGRKFKAIKVWEPLYWGSSVSIVSDYGLDDRAVGVRSPAEAKDFSSSLCVQTGSGAHPASCTLGTGGPFPGGKAGPWRDADHSPHLPPRSRGAIHSLPSSANMGCSGTALVFFMHWTDGQSDRLVLGSLSSSRLTSQRFFPDVERWLRVRHVPEIVH
jgi:hypothetical protein